MEKLKIDELAKVFCISHDEFFEKCAKLTSQIPKIIVFYHKLSKTTIALRNLLQNQILYSLINLSIYAYVFISRTNDYNRTRPLKNAQFCLPG